MRVERRRKKCVGAVEIEEQKKLSWVATGLGLIKRSGGGKRERARWPALVPPSKETTTIEKKWHNPAREIL